MPSLLESVSQAIPQDLFGHIGKAAGLTPERVAKGLGVAAPVIVGALAQKSSTANGLEHLLQLLSHQSRPAPLGAEDIGKLAKPGAQKNLLAGVFGPGLAAVTTSLNNHLGYDVTPLLAIAAPVVLQLVSKTKDFRKLDMAGVAQFLQEEHRAFEAEAGAGAAVVNEALDAGREAAAMKDRYTAEEWETVRLGPVAAAQVVMLASPSGLAGSVKEISSVLDALKAGRAHAATIPAGLLNVAFGEELSREEFMIVAKDRTPSTVLDRLRGAVATVATKNPADVAKYKGLVLDTAQRVAAAAKEGGFLGMGGTPVSKEEQSALDQIRNALNT